MGLDLLLWRIYFRKEIKKKQIFVIGFHKTGTTSLGAALKLLGMNPSVWSDDRHRGSYKFFRYRKLFKKYDAFEDEPFSEFYQLLDDLFPNAKFILTVRDEKAWIESCQKHFGSYLGVHSLRPKKLRKRDKLFHQKKYGEGCPIAGERIWKERYMNHNHSVALYFKERPEKLLVIDITRHEAPWEALCKFLDKDIPCVPFPHANQSFSTK
jgi:hypothetical protein